MPVSEVTPVPAQFRSFRRRVSIHLYRSCTTKCTRRLLTTEGLLDTECLVWCWRNSVKWLEAFQILAAATGKAWLGLEGSLKEGATRWLVAAERSVHKSKAKWVLHHQLSSVMIFQEWPKYLKHC